MKKTVITMEYDDKFETDILTIRTELKDFLEENLLEKLFDENIDHKKLVDLTHHFIFDKVKKEFEKDFGINELRKPQDFLLFNIRLIDFCLDYGFIILDTIANLEGYQKIATKINDKIADA